MEVGRGDHFQDGDGGSTICVSDRPFRWAGRRGRKKTAKMCKKQLRHGDIGPVTHFLDRWDGELVLKVCGDFNVDAAEVRESFGARRAPEGRHHLLEQLVGVRRRPSVRCNHPETTT